LVLSEGQGDKKEAEKYIFRTVRKFFLENNRNGRYIQE